jgi:hypothetical protein
MVDALKEYQTEAGLSASGKLTLRVAAETDIGPFLLEQ